MRSIGGSWAGKLLLAIGLLMSGTVLAPAAEAVTVRLKWLHQAQFAGFYVAKDKGYYEAAGLDVSIQPGGSDFPAIQMVAGGRDRRDLSRESVRAVRAQEVGHRQGRPIRRQEHRPQDRRQRGIDLPRR